jgi:hypothetical protein
LNLQGAQVRTDPTNFVGLPPRKAWKDICSHTKANIIGISASANTAIKRIGFRIGFSFPRLLAWETIQ